MARDFKITRSVFVRAPWQRYGALKQTVRPVPCVRGFLRRARSYCLQPGRVSSSPSASQALVLPRGRGAVAACPCFLQPREGEGSAAPRVNVWSEEDGCTAREC